MLEILPAHFQLCKTKELHVCYWSIKFAIAILLTAQQRIWSHFADTHGKPGCNLPCDLYLEHCNWVCKMEIRCIGANLIPKALQQTGKCSGLLLSIIEQLDAKSGVSSHSTGHTMPSFKKNLDAVVKQLNASQLFH